MATFTINIQGVKETESSMNLIIQNVSRRGYHSIEITKEVNFEDLNANSLVQFKVLRRSLEKGLTEKDKDYFRYEEGENFAEAKLKKASNYIKEQKKKLNPSKSNKFIKTVSNNPLISNLLSALVGALVTYFFTCF